MMGGGGFRIVFMLGAIVFWALILALLVLAVRWLLQQTRGQAPLGHSRYAGPAAPLGADAGTPSPAALATLEERFAKGEVAEADFVRQRAILLRQQPPA